MNEAIQDLTFEEALRQLEETVAQLETGNLPLEASLGLYERGRQLAAYCGQLLDQAQLRIEQLTEDGEIVSLTPPT